MKCDLCKGTVEKTFLTKMKGTYVMKGKKKHTVCQRCQQKHSMDEIKKKLNV